MTFVLQNLPTMNTRIFILSLLLALQTNAQHFSITGQVKDGQEPVAGTQVFLLHPDQILLASAYTDDSGHFELKGLSEGPCQVRIASAGFEPFTSEVLNLAQSISYRPIALSRKTQGLKEVTVSGKKPLIEASADKLVLNVANSIGSEGNSVLEVLAQAPNVQVDHNENIALKGRQGVLIYVDGREVPLQGADLANYLKGMPANAVDKIELITNPGPKYDAAGVAGIIHIKTRRERRKGINGTVNSSYNQGMYAKFNGGLSLNFRADPFSAYVNYNGGERNFTNDLDMMRRFISPGGADTVYHQVIHSRYKNPYHNLTAGGDYKLSPRSTIGLVFSGGLNQYRIKGHSHTEVLGDDGNPLYQLINTTDGNNKWDHYAVNLNLRQQLSEDGRNLIVNADYARYRTFNQQLLSTQAVALNGLPLSGKALLWGDMDGATDIRSLKADYEHPVDEKTKLFAGAKVSYVTADNAPVFYTNASGSKAVDHNKSNHFIYTENINAAYVQGSRDWEKWNLQAGLRAEQTNVTGNEKTLDTSFRKQYMNIFPSLSVTRRLNEAHDLGLTLSRRIERPNYRQLNPFRIYLDQSSVNQGNPNLNPALTWSAELSHVYQGKFVTTLGFSRTTDVIAQTIRPGVSSEGAKMTLIMDDNLATNTLATLSGAYPFQVTKWWTTTNSFTGFYSHYAGEVVNTPLSKGSLAAELNTVNEFTLPNNFSLQLSAWYQSPQIYGYMQLKSMYSVNAAVQKTFWDRKATLKLTVQDIFRSVSPRGSSIFATYHEDFTVLRDTRTAGISFSYRFGNSRLGQINRNKTGAIEEMQRASGN